ncbi:hypothetical protein DACRYDRAFT_112657 [Dacryopinax primogenitus]|uniref:Uncharacterized protein n=1 Tax=Dacryopinax primogenitus (strain DJM 731) TaxID=1858805 RepID=M5FNT4_DACPD|nr:uncharacterized protein DACRYDRAFT_112657 [Dacryopinax primogenitus]EJT96548.1 hypothetical protein DACRYDRAFT_112657 [Dacryopinax primogenitus]
MPSTKRLLSDSEPHTEHAPSQAKKPRVSSEVAEHIVDQAKQGHAKRTSTKDRNALAEITNEGATVKGTPAESEPPRPNAVAVPEQAAKGPNDKSEPAPQKETRQESFEQRHLRMAWETNGVVLDCTMGMDGPLRSLRGIRSVEAAQQVVKAGLHSAQSSEWPRLDKAQILNCLVLTIHQDPVTSLFREEFVGWVVPRKGARGTRGATLDVTPLDKRAMMGARWKAYVERDRL